MSYFWISVAEGLVFTGLGFQIGFKLGNAHGLKFATNSILTGLVEYLSAAIGDNNALHFMAQFKDVCLETDEIKKKIKLAKITLTNRENTHAGN